MAASSVDISEWFDRGIDNRFQYMIVACDTFDYEDYPCYCANMDALKQKLSDLVSAGMQRVMEIYDLRLPKQSQLTATVAGKELLNAWVAGTLV